MWDILCNYLKEKSVAPLYNFPPAERLAVQTPAFIELLVQPDTARLTPLLTELQRATPQHVFPPKGRSAARRRHMRGKRACLAHARRPCPPEGAGRGGPRDAGTEAAARGGGGAAAVGERRVGPPRRLGSAEPAPAAARPALLDVVLR